MIAKYTQQIMDALDKHGECEVGIAGSITESIARSRIQNAANRLGIKVSTAVQFDDNCQWVKGTVIKNDIMTEDWLIANLPEEWNYDCTFEPEMAFVIMAPGCNEHFIIPTRLLKGA